MSFNKFCNFFIKILVHLLLHLFLGNIVFVIIVNGIFFSITFLCYFMSHGNAMGFSNVGSRTSLVVQCLRIHLPMQGTRVPALVSKIPHAEEQLSP